MKKKGKKIRIKYNRIVAFLLLVFVFVFLIYYVVNIKIENIIINNKTNIVLNDQEIIDMANISDYPVSLKNSSFKIKRKLENSPYIYKAKVSKKGLKTVNITIEENYPLFFNSIDNKTVLYDGTTIERQFSNIPSIINYIPDVTYSSLIEKMKKLDYEILTRISQIEYKPSDFDDERFLLFMNDGNYVYITLYKFDNLNKYLDIIVNFRNKRGILYLDSGNYFEIKEN